MYITAISSLTQQRDDHSSVNNPDVRYHYILRCVQLQYNTRTNRVSKAQIHYDISDTTHQTASNRITGHPSLQTKQESTVFLSRLFSVSPHIEETQLQMLMRIQNQTSGKSKSVSKQK